MKSILLLIILASLVACKGKAHPQLQQQRIISTTPVLDHFVGRLTQGTLGLPHRVAIQSQGECLHDHALSVEEFRALCSASLIVSNGLNFEPFLEKALAQCPQVPVFRAFEGCQPMLLAESHEEGHDGDFDPHAWFGSQQVDCMLGNLANALVKLDSTRRDSILANAAQTRSALRTLWDSVKTRYASLQGKDVVVFHSAYNYLLREFGMNVVASVSEEHEGASPNAKESAKLIQMIRTGKIELLLAGESELPEIAKMVAKESGARLVPMLTMLESMDTNDSQAYEHILLENLRKIQP